MHNPASPSLSRRSTRLAVAMMISVAVSFSGAIAPSAAPAATAAPTLAPSAVALSAPTVVPGADRVTATWPAVAGASSYQLRVSTSKNMSKARITTTAGTTAVVAKLKTSKTYYVQVTAPQLGAVSSVTKTKTTAATTGRGTITSVRPEGYNTVRISWKRFARATSIDVRLSWDNTPLVEDKAGQYAVLRGLPATATSAVMAIPQNYQRLVGSTTGNPAYVRIISYNGSRSRTSKVAYGWPAAAPAQGTPLRVATFNVTGIAGRAAFPDFSWAKKREAVARTIAKAAPDVLLVQEASQSRISGSGSPLQYQDLAGLLREQGLSLADADTQTSAPGSRGNHIFVRNSAIAVLDSGLVASSSLAKTDWSKSEDRYNAWALLQVRATGEQFFAVSVHLQGDDAVKRRQLRLDLVDGLSRFIAERNPRNVPVVLGGDFNVGFNYPSAFTLDAPTRLVDLGWTDTAAANTRENVTRSTSNSGFPSRPKSYTYVGTRIDYLFTRNAGGPIANINQMVMNANGTINATYYGSDHNLQWATISLG